MRYYYGANKEVVKPEYNKGNPSNDYGLGFYLTPDKDIARLWATQYEEGYVIEYDVDVNSLKILELATTNNEDILKWISLLISHRFSLRERKQYLETIKWLESHYPFSLGDYDVIVGYRADDSYFDYSRDFVANNLSLELLKHAMMIGKLGTQFVLMSEKSFNHIKFIRSEKVERSDGYQIFRNKAKSEYQQLKKEDSIHNTFLRDIMREKDNEY